ncbi:hypothetical protein ACUL41_13355 [Virgibacillus natechei]
MVNKKKVTIVSNQAEIDKPSLDIDRVFNRSLYVKDVDRTLNQNRKD